MMRVLCKENNFEYTGEGYLQCRKRVICPKKGNNRILGYDCLLFIDNLPKGCALPALEVESLEVTKSMDDIQNQEKEERKEEKEERKDKIVFTMDTENIGISQSS